MALNIKDHEVNRA